MKMDLDTLRITSVGYIRDILRLHRFLTKESPGQLVGGALSGHGQERLLVAQVDEMGATGLHVELHVELIFQQGHIAVSGKEQKGALIRVADAPPVSRARIGLQAQMTGNQLCPVRQRDVLVGRPANGLGQRAKDKCSYIHSE